ncbi:MAG: hypothetical protein JWQ27_1284 [Ferruginibacter sp.]|nr:hypothetical protein [Ferruginibacter sp.]
MIDEPKQDQMTPFLFLLICLACWRLTHLLSKEDGPFDLVYLLRKKAGAGFFGSLLDCFYCVSIWIAFPLVLALGYFWWEKLLYWLSVSGAACILEQATTTKPKLPQDQLPDYKED